MARRGRGGIEGDADVGGVLLFQDGEKRVDEAVEGGGVDAFGVPDRGLDEGEVGAVNEGHAVEQEKAVHGPVEPRKGGAGTENTGARFVFSRGLFLV